MGGSESDSFGSDLLPFAQAPTEDAPSGPFTGTGRYRLVRSLGEGSFGTVYEVHDVEHDRQAALKLLRRASPSWLYRFKREFRSLAGVRHRNLVRLDELSAAGDHAFFTMELVAGRPLDRHVVDHRHELSSIYRQLAEGVHALHRAGLLHRDIKPSNVMVEQGGRVVLLDFGLAIPRDRLTTQLAGTPAYMAPELWNGTPPSAASDWFAVGAMLYESLTGTTGNDFGGTRVSGQLPPRVVPAGELAPDEPLLAALCDALLDQEPSRRPAGEEVLERLGTTPAAPTAAPELFVGRRVELDALHRAMEVAGPMLALVEGAPGVGKTALLRRFTEEVAARLPEALVLSGACHERESVPYKALDGVIDELSRVLCRMPRVDVERCMPRSTAALGRLFPVLRQVEAVRRLEDGSGVSREDLRRRGGAALRELFVRISDRRRVIIVVDDVQWGDIDSAALLSQLVHGPDAPPIAYIAASSGESDERGFLREMQRQRDAQLSPVAETRIALGGLAPAEAEELVARLSPDADPETRARVVRDAGGNAMFLGELARYGVDRSIDEVMRARLDALSPTARACLEVLAVAGQALPVRVLRAIVSPTEDPSALVGALEADHLIRRRSSESDIHLECYHARIGRAALGRMDPGQRRRTHAELAEAFAALCPEDAERIGHHLAEAGERRRAHVELSRAAESAAGAGAHELAATLFERALSLLSAEERHSAMGSAVYARLAEMLSLTGFGKRAAETCLLAARHASPESSRELRALAAQELLAGGYMEEGKRIFFGVMRDLGVKLPETTVGMLARMGRNELLRRRNGYRYELRAERDVPAIELARIDALHAGSVGVWGVSPMLAFMLQGELLSRALKAGEPRRLLDALCYHVMLLSFGGSLEAHHGLRALSDLAARCPSEHASMCQKMGEAVSFHLDTRWNEIEHIVPFTMMHHSRAGVTARRHLMRVELMPYNAHFWMGEVAKAARGLPAVLELTRERGDRMGYLWMSLIWSWVVCAHDQPERALDIIARARRDWPSGSETLQDFWTRNNTCDVALYRDDTAVADKWNEAIPHWQRFLTRRNRDGGTQYYIRRAIITLARARRRPFRWRSLLREAEDSIAHAEALRLPWGLAWATALRGSLAWLRGNTPLAAQQLSDSEPLLQGVNMLQVLAAIRRALALLAVGTRRDRFREQSEAYFREQGIVSPMRFTRLYLPMPLETEVDP